MLKLLFFSHLIAFRVLPKPLGMLGGQVVFWASLFYIHRVSLPHSIVLVLVIMLSCLELGRQNWFLILFQNVLLTYIPCVPVRIANWSSMCLLKFSMILVGNRHLESNSILIVWVFLSIQTIWDMCERRRCAMRLHEDSSSSDSNKEGRAAWTAFGDWGPWAPFRAAEKRARVWGAGSYF